MKSTNYGKQWVKQSLNKGTTISDIKFITPDIGWAIGNSGLIIHTVNGGVTLVQVDNVQPYSFQLYQNFPNPFNPSTHIEYQLPHQGFVSLRIYDMLGREVTTLVNEEKAAGTYSLYWNALQYSSGVYFAVLECHNNISAMRMLLLK
jgi:hypothetical protein